MKQIVWQTAFAWSDDGAEVPRHEQVVDMKLLLGHINEIQLMLDCLDAGITAGLTKKRIMRRFSLVEPQWVEANIRNAIDK